jgi:glycolate oxidase FAD binding subunit
MSETIKPENGDQLQQAVAGALADQTALNVIGGGSKRGYGRPGTAATGLDLSALSGIVLFEPSELVISAQAATPMADIAAVLAEHRQHMAFEPADLGPLMGTAKAGESDGGTLGAAVACNLAGPRRMKSGAARDHVLGFQAVSGHGEPFKSGGRMVKNVTGFDLSKLMAGSFGTLAVMTEVILRVLPIPEETRTLLLFGADDATAQRAMTKALQGAFEVAGAAHLPRGIAAGSATPAVSGAGTSVTALRVEGPKPSVEYRNDGLAWLLGEYGETATLDTDASLAFWTEIRDVTPFADEQESQIWRLSVAPSAGAAMAAEILEKCDGRVFYDWGGGLLWLALSPLADAGHEVVRSAVGSNGHATLVRAAHEVRAAVPVFQPQADALAALTKRIKDSFDPRAILNPGRMYADV